MRNHFIHKQDIFPEAKIIKYLTVLLSNYFICEIAIVTRL